MTASTATGGVINRYQTAGIRWTCRRCSNSGNTSSIIPAISTTRIDVQGVNALQ